MSETTTKAVLRVLRDKEDELDASFQRFDGESKIVVRGLLDAAGNGAEGFVNFDDAHLRDALGRACAAVRDARPLAQEIVELRQRLL